MTAPENIYKKIWRKHFKGRLINIAKDPVANYVLQKLIIHARNDEQVCSFDNIFYWSDD